jgi:hypothetical protein
MTNRFPGRGRLPLAVLIAAAAPACRTATPETPGQAAHESPAGIAPECSAAEYRQFDFWIGVWEVKHADGRPAGTNRIEPILRGCALHEQWISVSEPYRGESFNTYRQETGTWHQTWIDNTGGTLLLEGKFEDGRMRLEGVTVDSTGRKVLNRITWSRMDDSGNRVRQHWETSLDGIAWQSAFDGFYAHEAPPSPAGQP